MCSSDLTTDLYAMEFDPCERGSHYQDVSDAGRFDAQAEQRHASDNKTLPPHVRHELDLLDQSDLVILQ